MELTELVRSVKAGNLEAFEEMYGRYAHNVHYLAYSALGFAGLMGAGRTELMRAVTGADKKENGDIYIRGKKVEIKNFTDAVNNRIAYRS